MCGIAGILNRDQEPIAPDVLQSMTDAMKHRGPDGSGYFTAGAVGLGHRRLAIIDLSDAGHQPMHTQDGRYSITYNGEVYNYRELRAELVQKGYRFFSESDTEVVLNAFAEWGETAVSRFNGMFAIAIWDREKQSLFLARDRYGIKPLYYVFTGKHFLFASEQKALLQHPAVKRELDLEALLEYFTFQNLFGERTLLKGVRMFPAAHWARIEPGGVARGELPLFAYWDYSFREPEGTVSDAEYTEELDRLFSQAVKRQLVSDVDVGSYLSGGMDSGSIAAVAAGHLPYIKTFTCGFDLSSASGLELGFDEREKAERMSYLFKTEHYEMVLKAGDMERVMKRLAWHIEEPRIGQSYPNFYAAQLAGKFVKVVLSGGGGDELFGGYPWRYYRAVVNDNFEHYVDKYYGYWQRLVDNPSLKSMFQPVWPHVKDVRTRDIFRDVFDAHAQNLTRPEDYINHSLYFEAKTFLHGLLVVEDKLSMAHGLETRLPFLDNDMVDFAMNIPVRLKLANLGDVILINENEPADKPNKYFSRTRDGKLLLRKMMARHIPSEITDAVKQGFSAPDASWFKGESIDYVREEILGPDARLYDYFDRDTVRSLVVEHLDGHENRRLLIWSLLSFEWWLRSYLA